MMQTSADPFEYLEDANDPRTKAWTAEQNARALAVLDAVPGRAALAVRLGALIDAGTLGCPVSSGNREFYVARRAGQQQALLFVREGGGERMLFDPVTFDATALTAIDWFFPSPGGTYVAFGLSKNGDEHSTLYLLEVATGELLSEAIPDTRFCEVAWLPDERSFYYTRHPDGSDYNHRIFLHTVGVAHEKDMAVFGEGRAPEDILAPKLSASGRWLLVTVLRGWVASDVYLADLNDVDSYFVAMVEGRDAIYDCVLNDDRIFIRTDEGASRFRVFVADPLEPRWAAWSEFEPERKDAKLEAIALARGTLVLQYLRDVMLEMWYRPLGAGAARRLEHESLGESLLGLSAHDDSPDVYLLTVGFFQGPTVTHVAFSSKGEATAVRWGGIDAPFARDRYRCEQHWFTSKDGTRVPMFVLSRANAKFDGTAPAVLSGYGGFAISRAPAFQPALVPWLDAGGVYAIANLRGGGEFGEEWHRAGMRANKQNVFDDAIAAAEYLASSKIADPKRIGIFGGSNGGLLVAAVTVQRPDLFRAVVCAVPLCDMLRYTRFSVGRFWISEYGDPDDADDAAVLRAYSPYHNVRDGTPYPAFFAVAAESDGRVDPAHARKMAARLQEATTSKAPVLAFIEQNAGHGMGKPRDKQVEELVDRWGFLASQLSVELEKAAAS